MLGSSVKGYCSNGERFLGSGYGYVPHVDWLRGYSATVVPSGGPFGYKGVNGLWWLGKISTSTSTDGAYLVRLLNGPGPNKLPLPACFVQDCDGSCTRFPVSENTLS